MLEWQHVKKNGEAANLFGLICCETTGHLWIKQDSVNAENKETN